MLQRLKSKIKKMSNVKKLSVLLCALVLGTMTIGSTYAYVVTGTPSLVNLFVNGLEPDGDLVIEKNLEHPYGDDYVLPDGLEFNFRVELGDEFANETLKTTQGEKTADKNGVLNVTVAPGGRTTVFDIDSGTKVTVKEIQLGKGFTADEPTQEITVKKHQDNLLTFVNTYKAAPADTAKLQVTGTKDLEGRLWQEGDKFTFRMEVFEDGQWVSLGEEEVVYKEGTEFNKFNFTDTIQEYKFDDIGTYYFRVTEVEGSIGGITYDKAESYFDVVVGDADMDGYLEVEYVTSVSNSNTEVKDRTAVNIKFLNKYGISGCAEININITKKLDDNSGQSKTPEGFKFELLDAAGEVVKVSEASTIEGLTGIILVFTPADAGKTFEYQLREVDGGKTVDGMKYDDKVYNLEVAVHDDLDGTISAEIYEADGEGNGKATFEAEFKNEYDPANAYMTLKGEKRLEGRDLEPDEFDFNLYKVKDDSFSVDGAELLDTASNDSDGDFAFETRSYSKVGTYRYLILEDNSDPISGITYDKTAYSVTVVVTDEAGQLKVEKTVINNKGQAAELIFNNSYKAEPAPLPLEVFKEYEDKDGKTVELRSNQFKFDIYVADENFVKQGAAFKTVSNDAEGKAIFDDISFSEEGVYRYVIEEQIPEGAATIDHMDGSGDIAYDNSVFHVEVHVEDPGTGKLKIASSEIEGDGIPMDKVVFNNIYLGKSTDETTEPTEDSTDGSGDQTKPDKPGKDDGTQTGDDFNMTLAVVLLLISAVLAAVIVIRRRDTE